MSSDGLKQGEMKEFLQGPLSSRGRGHCHLHREDHPTVCSRSRVGPDGRQAGA